MEDLKEYKEQLAQVEEALQLDPNDAELKTLRQELMHLIELTQSLHPQPAASSSSSSPPPAPSIATSSSSAIPSLKAGDDCMAKYAADGRWYPARVTAVSGSSKDPVFSIIFKGYNNTEMLRSPDVKPKTKAGGGTSSSGGSSNGFTASSSFLAPSSSSSAPATSSPAPSSSASARNKLTPEEEAERERRRKRSEKKTERHEQKTQVANHKANSWQKFAKKGAKKGYGIPGAQGSMFKTPDDPLAKVGVVGAGRGMTGYGDRSKHVYQAEGAGAGSSRDER